ncbi:MAG: Ig-like domain-containing protein [Acholeplasmatales bacterium]
MKRIFLLLTILLSFFLISCKDETEFEFECSAIILSVVDGEAEICYKGPSKMEFISDNDHIMITGKTIKAVKIGTGYISPKDKRFSHIKLRVEVKPVFEFWDTSINVGIGLKERISYTRFEGYNIELIPINDYITYEDYYVTGVKVGESGLLARVTKGDYLYEVTLPVNVLSRTSELVVINIFYAWGSEVNVGERTKLGCTLLPNTYDTVTWASSDESIATIDSEGYVTGHKAGVAIMTASVGNISDSVTITVKGVISNKDYVDLYYINDLHGAIEREGSSLGLAYIANFVDKRREENPNTLLLAGGDILQGQAMSNYYYGASTLTIMELMGFDAMAIGNHEFDWGLEVVTNQFDPNTGIVSFPLLGINIREKATNESPKNILPYVMIEKPNFKVGVIGVIGEYLESSIAYNKVKDYDFINALDLVKDAARTLRVDGADFVVVVIHDDNNTLNYNIASLVGIERVDAIFNAHSHALIKDVVNGKPVIQSKHNGEYVGHIRLYRQGSFSSNNINYHDDLNTPNATVLEQIEIYKEEVDPIFNKKIIKK